MKNESIYTKPITLNTIITIVIPTIIMTLIQASYSMIDGMFISNILGDLALSALTLISPYLNFFIAIGALFASGGSAVVMKKMGENKKSEARRDFTTLTIIAGVIGLILSLIFFIFTKPLVSIFNIEGIIFSRCMEYLSSYSLFIIPQILFAILQIFTIGSGNPKLAMITSLIGGATNIFLDFILIKALNLGMTGAAIASGVGMLLPSIILILKFMKKRGDLYFSKFKFDIKVVLKTFSNGVSEFASNLASGIVIMLFNSRMLAIAGPDGVAASTITFYVFGFMSELYMGYMLGVSPLLSYFYGSKESFKLRKIKNISITSIGIISIVTTILAILSSNILVGAFTKTDSISYTIASNGNKLFSIALLLVGFNTFSSMLFTALSNGKISAIISFSRSFVFLSIAIIVLPSILGINGLWLSVPLSELLAFIISIFYIKKFKLKYNY